MAFIPDVTTGSIDPQIQEQCQEALLRRSIPFMIYQLAGKSEKARGRLGDYIKRRRYESLTQISVPGVEGRTGPQATQSKTDYTVQLKQYFNWIGLSDKAVSTNLEDVVKEETLVLAENFKESTDVISRDLMMGTTSLYYGGNVANRAAVITKAEETDFEGIDQLLLNNKARYFDAISKGDTRYGTTPIGPTWLCYVHPYHKKDIKALTGFTPVEQYIGHTKTYPSEIGIFDNFRFVMGHFAPSPLTHVAELAHSGGAVGATGLRSTDAANVDIYPMFIFGQDAYIYSKLDDLTTEHIVKAFGHGDDPVNQRMTIGWKLMYTLLLTQELNMYRLDVGVTDIS